MIDYFKCYRVFLCNKWIKLLLYLGAPLLTIGWYGLTALLTDWPAVTAQCLVGSMVLFYELLLDSYVYGGILCKDTNTLGYLITSEKGMPVLHKSLIMDKIRRLIETTVVLSIIYVNNKEGIDYFQVCGMVLAVSLVTELCLMVCRKAGGYGWAILLTFVGDFVVVVFLFLVSILPSWCVIFFLVFYLWVIGLSNGFTVKKAKEQYYDGKVEKEF